VLFVGFVVGSFQIELPSPANDQLAIGKIQDKPDAGNYKRLSSALNTLRRIITRDFYSRSMCPKARNTISLSTVRAVGQEHRCR